MRKLILSCIGLIVLGTALFANRIDPNLINPVPGYYAGSVTVNGEEKFSDDESDFDELELRTEDSSSNESDETSMPIAMVETKQKITALYMVSAPGDFVGGGRVKSYYQDVDGNFSVKNRKARAAIRGNSYSYEEVDIGFVGTNLNFYESFDRWGITFRAEEGRVLAPGVYTGAERAPFAADNCPGLSMTGCGRGCNKLSGEFEILEILYNEDGNVESFAANFVQRCEERGPPLFGSIRINSSVPIEECFKTLIDDRLDTAFLLTKHNPITKQAMQPLLIANENLFYKIEPVWSDRSRNIITVLGDDGEWSFHFYSVSPKKPGTYYEYDHDPVLVIRTPQGNFLETEDFRVGSSRRDDGESVSLGFKVVDKNGDIIEGFLRYNHVGKGKENLEMKITPQSLDSLDQKIKKITELGSFVEKILSSKKPRETE